MKLDGRLARFDLLTLRLFVVIADEGQLTAAAEREHLAIAAVSKRISDLESRIGTALLYRRARGVELTPAGTALLDHARRILDAVTHMQAELSEFCEGVRGHVRLSCNTSAIIAFLPQDLSRFARAYPDVRLELEERTSAESITAVLDGHADLGVFAAHVDPRGLHVRPYRRDQLVLVTPPEHRLADRRSLTFVETIGEDFVGLQQDTSLHALLHEQALIAGGRLRMRIQVRSFDAICRMVHHGLGVGVLPRRALYRHADGLQLRLIPLDDDWAQRELVIGVRCHDTLPVVVRHLIAHLRVPPEGNHGAEEV